MVEVAPDPGISMMYSLIPIGGRVKERAPLKHEWEDRRVPKRTKRGFKCDDYTRKK